MQIKKGLDLSTQDFFYDLFDGGYLDPEDICKSPADAKKVREAILLIDYFRQSIEEEYPDFLQ